MKKIRTNLNIKKYRLLSKMIRLPDDEDITYFTGNHVHIGRAFNDHNNKKREHIITHMSDINEEYTSLPKYGEDWKKLKTGFDTKMKDICPSYCSYKIEHKAGRKNNFDYSITFLDELKNKIAAEKVEFKFNAATIDDAPQFVSPMKPSQYMSTSFEEYYYDTYLVNLLKKFGFDAPERSLYLKTIHNNAPECMTTTQLLYYQGCKSSSKYTGTSESLAFYNNCKKISKECISNFISSSELNLDVLNQYLIESQHQKKYLLYKNGEFNIQTMTSDDYTIMSYSKNPKKARFEAITKTNKKINILLRWKNGNGIAFPAFQIS